MNCYGTCGEIFFAQNVPFVKIYLSTAPFQAVFLTKNEDDNSISLEISSAIFSSPASYATV